MQDKELPTPRLRPRAIKQQDISIIDCRLQRITQEEWRGKGRRLKIILQVASVLRGRRPPERSLNVWCLGLIFHKESVSLFLKLSWD